MKDIIVTTNLSSDNITNFLKILGQEINILSQKKDYTVTQSNRLNPKVDLNVVSNNHDTRDK